MTAAELIEELQKLPAYYPVVLLTPGDEYKDEGDDALAFVDTIETDNLHGNTGPVVVIRGM